MAEPRTVAEAFSRHEFASTYDQIADDVTWFLPGSAPILGKEAVVAACEQTLADLTETRTEFVRFLVVADDAAVAVDVVAHYTEPHGSVSVVSSADIYEFRDGFVAAITSYAVELDPEAMKVGSTVPAG